MPAFHAATLRLLRPAVPGPWPLIPTTPLGKSPIRIDYVGYDAGWRRDMEHLTGCYRTTGHNSYPYAIAERGFMDFQVYDVRTGNTGESYRSREEAVIGCFRLAVRNLVNE